MWILLPMAHFSIHVYCVMIVQE
uniref:Uncharacterized protein n=1 Tax=Arundo donax TaxID=35708 RepID=A0A0A9A2Q5_ARUDO